MEMVVRSEDPLDGQVEQPYRINITVDTELEARRAALERAWYYRMLVSRFNSILVSNLPDPTE
jgi:hypothetical protein